MKGYATTTATFEKQCRAGRAYAQERRAYRDLVPQLLARGVCCPRLLGEDPAQRLLILERLPGRPGTLDDDPEVFRQVGAALRQLHALDCPADPLPLPDALQQRAHSWCERAATANVQVDSILFERLAALPAIDRVWCHRDLQPQNWLVHQGTVALVDFEHCRPDHPLEDVVRLEARGWSAAAREAFFTGYGCAPSPTDLRAVLSLYALQTVTWAVEHQDAALLAVGRHAALRSELPITTS